jgi:hypothetical protein
MLSEDKRSNPSNYAVAAISTGVMGLPMFLC